MKDNTEGVFLELIQAGYLCPGQCCQIRWFNQFVLLGELTASGCIRFVNKPYFTDPPVATAAAAAAEPESNDYTLSQLSGTTPSSSSSSVTNPNAFSPLMVRLSKAFCAPSTAAERSYEFIQNSDIVLPRNEEEARHHTFKSILNSTNVRHNGYCKVEFLYVKLDTPTLVTVQASKLRKPEDRQKLRIHLLRPFLFSRMANALLPQDDLSVAEYNLATSQSSPLYTQSSVILQELRSYNVSSADHIAMLVDRLAQLELYLQQQEGIHMSMESFLQERRDMLQQRLGAPDTLFPAAEDLFSALGPTGVGVDEILACGSLPCSTTTSTATTTTTAMVTEERRVWLDIYGMYEQLLQSFQQLQPQVPADQSHDFYRAVCGYQDNLTHKQLLQSFYDYVDRCYQGDGAAMREDLMRYVTELHTQCMSLPVDQVSESKRLLEQHFLAMSDLVVFVDAALAERENQLLIPVSHQVTTSKQVDVLSQMTKSVQTQELDDPNSTDSHIVATDTCTVVVYTSLKRVPGKRTTDSTPRRFVVQKRARFSS